MPKNPPSTQIAKRLNKSISPGDDFYQHVNGKWLKNTDIPPEESKWGSFYELREANYKKLKAITESLIKQTGLKNGSIEQKVRDFYLSASHKDIEQTGLNGIAKLFAEIDDINDSNLLHQVAKLHLYWSGVFWDFYVDQDEKQSSSYIFRLTQRGLSLPDRDYYLATDKKMQAIRRALELHIPKMLKLVGVKVTTKQAKDILKLEKGLAKASFSSIKQRDVQARYNKVSFAKLKKLYPNIDWTAYFKGLGIKPPKELIVDQPQFFTHVNSLFANLDIDVVKNYLKWHLITISAGRMGDKFAQANFDFYGKVLSGTPKLQPRWKRTVLVLDEAIGEAIGQLYVNKYFPPKAKQRMEVLVADIRSAFAERIRSLDWMDPKTKQYALKKLGVMRVKIGHAKKLNTYQALKIKPDSYLDNYLDARVLEAKRHLGKLGTPFDPEEWWMTPPTVNAYFSPTANEIVFPAGILQPPFFDFNADDAVNYGAIGAVIGHELTHGFDDQGCLYDHLGNLRNWWTITVKQKFTKQASKMVKQADSFEVLKGQNLKGKLTLGENIADLGGLEIAMQALQKALQRAKKTPMIEGMSPEQRFFYSLAIVECSKMRPEFALQVLLSDPHSPGEFRVNNPLRNMDSFYRAFNVKPTDKLYLAPPERVRIW